MVLFDQLSLHLGAGLRHLVPNWLTLGVQDAFLVPMQSKFSGIWTGQHFPSQNKMVSATQDTAPAYIVLEGSLPEQGDA